MRLLASPFSLSRFASLLALCAAPLAAYASGGGGQGGGEENQAAGEAALIRRKIENPPLKDVAALLDRGDSKAADGDFLNARKDYENSVKMAGAPSASMHIRIGFCSEQIGDSNRALAAYREVIAKGDSPLADFAALSQARVWALVDNPVMAFEIAAPLALGPNYEAEASKQVAEEAQLLACYLRTRQACESEPRDLLNDRGLAFPTPPNNPQDQWRLLRACETASNTPAAKVGDVLRMVQRTTDGLDGHYIEGSIIDAPVAEALETLVGLAGRNLRIAPAARQVLAERKITQAVPENRLDRVLTAFCERYGLIWQEESNEVAVMEPGELPLPQLIDYRKRAAKASIDDYLAAKGTHYAANHLKLLGGNLAFLTGDMQGAASRYESLRKLGPNRTLNAAAMFNLAKTQLEIGDRQRAMARFYDAIDAEISEYMGPCYLYVGRMQLEDDHVNESIQAFHRALAHSSNSEQRRKTTLCLAIAQMTSNNPFAAAKLLYDQRGQFEKSPDEIPYVFIAALANSLISKDLKLRHELKQLAGLCSYVSPDSFFGATGYRPMALAYDKLELLDDWKGIILKALDEPSLKGSKHIYLAQLGEIHRRSGDLEQAVKYLQASKEHKDPKWRSEVREKIIRVSFEGRLDDLCISESLLALKEDHSETSRQDILRMLGKVYERKGNRRLAVRCFAGVEPDEEAPAEHVQ